MLLTVIPANVTSAVVGWLIHVNPQPIKFQILVHTLHIHMKLIRLQTSLLRGVLWFPWSRPHQLSTKVS